MDPCPRVAAPSDVGLCPERLDRLEKLAVQLVSDGSMPFVHITVVRRGSIAFEVVHGSAAAENGLRAYDAATQPIVPIHSMTKSIVSAAACRLIERGLIDLAEPVSNHLPEFAQQNLRVYDAA
eukprot:2818550-Prymnesium_polylepis.1